MTNSKGTLRQASVYAGDTRRGFYDSGRKTSVAAGSWTAAKCVIKNDSTAIVTCNGRSYVLTRRAAAPRKNTLVVISGRVLWITDVTRVNSVVTPRFRSHHGQ